MHLYFAGIDELTLADEMAMVDVWEAAMEAVCAKAAAWLVPTAAVAVAEALEEYLDITTRLHFSMLRTEVSSTSPFSHPLPA